MLSKTLCKWNLSTNVDCLGSIIEIYNGKVIAGRYEVIQIKMMNDKIDYVVSLFLVRW